jgi:hypothetical protein
MSCYGFGKLCFWRQGAVKLLDIMWMTAPTVCGLIGVKSIMKVKKTLPYILFFGGLLIDLAAMFGEYADQIPFVMRGVAPSYYHAQHGLKTLRREGHLSKESEGYNEIAKILLKKTMSNVIFTKSNPGTNLMTTNKVGPTSFTNFSIENIRQSGEMAMTYDSNGAHNPVTDGISFDLHSKSFPFNNEPIGSKKANYDSPDSWREEKLSEKIDELKTRNLLIFVFTLFFIGSSFAVIGFFLERKAACDENPKPANQADNHQPKAAEKANHENPAA